MASHRPLKGLAAERSSSDHTRPFTRRFWWRSPRGLYYGWVLVVALGLTTIISYGTTQYLFGVLVIPLGSTFGWGRASISGAYSLGLIISGLLGVPIGRLVDKRGARLLMTLGSALAGIALIGLAWVHTLWQFYGLWSGVLGLATALTLYPVSFTVVTNWFERRRGKVLAVLTLLGGLASPIFVPFAGWLLLHLGWRSTVIVLGLMQLCIALPIHGLVLRRHPEDLGFSPDGKHSFTLRPELPMFGSTLREVLRRPVFWTLTASLSLEMMGSTVVLVHQVPSLIDRGYDAVLAATLAGMLGLASLPGRYVFNIMSERVSPQRLLGISVAFQAVGVTVLIQATSVGWLVIYVALYGAAYGAIAPLRASVMADQFGRRAYGSITAVQGIPIAFCAALGPLAAGWLYDVLGGYAVAFWLCVCVFLLAAMGILMTPRPETKAPETMYP